MLVILTDGRRHRVAAFSRPNDTRHEPHPCRRESPVSRERDFKIITHEIFTCVTGEHSRRFHQIVI